MVRLRCANCTVCVQRLRKHELTSLDDQEIVSIIRKWHPNRSILNTDFICHRCWKLVRNALHRAEDLETPIFGYQDVCANCGQSLKNVRSHRLERSTARELRIYNVIAEWIVPNQINSHTQICHPCWIQADQHIMELKPQTSHKATDDKKNNIEAAVMAQPIEETPRLETPRTASVQPNSIMLPDYTRAASTESGCIFPNCENQHSDYVPLSVRRYLLIKFNYYVPKDCRVCKDHLISDWDTAVRAAIHLFTSEDITDTIEVLSSENICHDFTNMTLMPDHLIYFWTGLSTDKFKEILSGVPQLLRNRKRRIGLAAYLIQLHKGDSDECLASFFKMPTEMLKDLMDKARDTLRQHLLQIYEDLNNLSRQKAERKLLITNEPLGNPDKESEEI